MASGGRAPDTPPGGDAPPKRVQLSRAKGWRMPPNTVKVDRSTKWGNPLHIHNDGQYGFRVTGWVRHWYPSSERVARRFAVFRFRVHLLSELGRRQFPVEDLRGRNLACWCALDQPCHADVLLELANGEQKP